MPVCPHLSLGFHIMFSVLYILFNYVTKNQKNVTLIGSSNSHINISYDVATQTPLVLYKVFGRFREIGEWFEGYKFILYTLQYL